MNATEQAKQAYKESLVKQSEADAAFRKTREPHALKVCDELFGREPDEIDGSNIVIDGLALNLYDVEPSNWRSGKQLEVHCPQCEDVFWADFYDLASLGKLLTEPPPHGYQCPKYPKNTVDVNTRLADAIREIMENH